MELSSGLECLESGYSAIQKSSSPVNFTLTKNVFFKKKKKVKCVENIFQASYNSQKPLKYTSKKIDQNNAPLL